MDRFLEQDARLSSSLRVAEGNPLLRWLATALAHSGDSWFWLAGLGVVWLAGSPSWKQWALVMIAGVMITAVLVLLIKLSVRRRRPEGNWGNIYRKSDPHSFPSGHAARAVMLTVLSQSLGPSWFSIVMLVWAPLVGLARVALGVHYFSDVIAGMALGIVMGLAVLKIY